MPKLIPLLELVNLIFHHIPWKYLRLPKSTHPNSLPISKQKLELREAPNLASFTKKKSAPQKPGLRFRRPNAVFPILQQHKRYSFVFRFFTSQIQFAALIVVSSKALITNCGYPAWSLWIQVFYGLSLIALFSNFYIKTYMQKKQKKQQ